MYFYLISISSYSAPALLRVFYKQQMRSSDGKWGNALVLLVFLTGLTMHAYSQVQECQFATPSNTSSFPYCSYFYNNCTEKTRIFQYCSYCGDHQTAVAKDQCRTLITLTKQSDCNAQCKKKQAVSQSSSSWIGVVVAIIIAFVAFTVVCCICRKFMAERPIEYSLPGAVMMAGEGVRLDEVASERRFSSPSDQPVPFEQEPLPYRHWEIIERKEGYSVEDQCIICLLACYHQYHTECIRQWFNVHEYCPTCKLEDIRNVNIYCRICRQREYSHPLWLFKRGEVQDICDGCRQSSPAEA